MIRTDRTWTCLLFVASLGGAGCEDAPVTGAAGPGGGAGEQDAASTGGGGGGELDTGPEAGPARDAGSDSSSSTGADGAVDASTSTDSSAGSDAQTDAGPDGVTDAASDAGGGGGCASDDDCPDLGPCAANACVYGECRSSPRDDCPPGEYCGAAGECVQGAECDSDADCDSVDPCQVNGRCMALVGRCEYRLPDLDGDGQIPVECGGLDCNDDPSADGERAADGLPERCDGIDNNCNGEIDEEQPRQCWDTYVCANPGTKDAACECPEGTELCNELCVDTQNDPDSCGGCRPGGGERCGSGGVCTDGACACQGGVECAEAENSCVDVDVDTAHCGECGEHCFIAEDRVGGLCLSGVCTDCGRPGEPCCATEEACDDGHCMGVPGEAGAVCEACGDEGEPCCDAPSSACRGAHLVCDANTCVTCGNLGEACCPIFAVVGAECGNGTILANPDLRCTGVALATGAVCADCGAVGEPCCRYTGLSSSDEIVSCDDESSVCFDDVCVDCGAPGQQCCSSRAGSWCRADSTCSATTGRCSA